MRTSPKLWTKAVALTKHGVDKLCNTVAVGAADGVLTLRSRVVMRDVAITIPADGDLPTKAYPQKNLLALTRAAVKGKSTEMTVEATDDGMRVSVNGRTFDIRHDPDESQLSRTPLKTPKKTKGTKVEAFGAQAFVDAMRFVVTAECQDITRIGLCRVHIDGSRMFATNGHVVHVADAIGGNIGGQVSVTTGRAVLDAAKATGADWVMSRLWGNGRMLELSIEGPLMSVLIKDTDISWHGPPLDALLADRGAESCMVDAEALARSMETAAKTMKLHDDQGVTLRINGDLRVASPVFSEVIPLAKKGTGDGALCINPAYVRDAAQMTGNVELYYGEPMHPVTIHAGDRTAIVMPMKGTPRD